MHWSQAEGLVDVVARLDALADQGLSEPACEYLRNHSRSGQAL
jgi:hypothetical protein